MSVPVFLDAPVHVRSPASSANLGPGFDALGLALGLYDEVTAAVAPEGLAIEVEGEGGGVARDETHLVVRAMRATFDRLGGQPSGLALRCRNRVPHGRGLGSSASAIVGGVQLARALVEGGRERLDDTAAFALASQLEGHPDNVAACWSGGLTLAWTADDGAHAVRAEVAPGLTTLLLIPPFTSSTAEVRGLLPAQVPHADAAFGAGRSALLVAALTGAVPASPDVLLAATEDRLHQPYRAPAMPATAAVVAAVRSAGHAAVVSGAGPTVLVLTDADGARAVGELEAVRAVVAEGWRVEALPVDTAGARVSTGPAAPSPGPGVTGEQHPAW